jgi:hypothetical protein
MKQIFYEYLRPGKDKMDYIWEHCIFVFDTNTLLNLYRYSKNTNEQFFKALENIKERIWIPYQVGKEYLENRINVINEQFKRYENYKKKTEKLFREILEDLKSKQHPFVGNYSEINKELENIKIKLFKDIDEQQEKLIAYNDDWILNKILEIFDKKTNDAYANKKLVEIINEGKNRYKEKILPGYMDIEKTDNIYGDFIIWCEMIDLAISQKSPIIFVTDDIKEDWWKKNKNIIISPRPELIKEFEMKTKQYFYMYSMERFLEYYNSFISSVVNSIALDEIKINRKKILDNFSTELLKDEYKKIFENNNELLKQKYLNAIEEIKNKFSLSTNKLEKLRKYYQSNLNNFYLDEENNDSDDTEDELNNENDNNT